MLYDIAFFIFSIFYLPALIFKGKFHKDFAERFGMYSEKKRNALGSASGAIWIQAVSVGEVTLCKALIPLLRNKFPDKTIVLSTITKTGQALARKMFSNDAIVMYYPLDFSFIVKKVIDLISPTIYVMIETEIWPNLLGELSRRSIPSVLINGRISDASFGKYKLVRPFFKSTLGRIKFFCMQSAADAERIIYLGAPADRVKVTGNMKFDIDMTVDEKSIQEMRRFVKLGDGEDLLVGGSTHRGEEEILLSVFGKLVREFPNLKLLIAPRHVERAEEVASLVRKHGFEPVKLSASNVRQAAPEARQIYILNMIGHLKDAYALGSLVYIGGSLVRHGGQNPIEPAIFEKPIIFGPHMFNFKNIARALLDDEGAIQIHCEKDLLETASALLKKRQRGEELGRNAKRSVLRNRGSTEENLKTIISSL